MSFWGELKRRNVVRVGVAYLVAAWVILQVVDVVAPILELPNWISRAILLFLAVGFVVTVFLAWAYELTPQGIQRDEDANKQDPGRVNAPRGSGFYVGLAAIVLVVGAGTYWYSGMDARWALNEGLPLLESHIDDGDWESAYELATRIDEHLPEYTALENYWDRFSYVTTIPTEPPGARVSRRPYAGSDDDWTVLGVTPLVNVRLPFGFSILEFELDGHETSRRVVGTEIPRYPQVPVLDRRPPNFAFAFSETFQLDRVGTIPDGFSWVAGADVEVEERQVSFNDYYLAKHEVTNRDFKDFVDSGGYSRADLWEHDIVIDGIVVALNDASRHFVDRTGRPGPSTWEAGTYPDGEADHPVAGVSWYEAAAYARFVGRELPTYGHWIKAFSTALLPAMLASSNIQGEATVAVGQSGSMGLTGTFDMVGNVREWCFNAVGDQRIIIGGGWNDAHYMVQESISDLGSLPPSDRSATNGFRLAFTADSPDVTALAREPMQLAEIAPDLTPASDEVFQIYRRAFDYDAGPLDPVIESTQDFGGWRRETITYSTAHGEDRITLYLDIPNNGAEVHQPIIYWPGSGALLLDSVADVQHRLEFILKNGRAVAYPVLAGTFQRRLPETPAWTTTAGRDLTIAAVIDFRRTIDYLETRPDIDRQNIGYFGTSWGGRLGAMVLAIEPRVKAAVLDQAGYNFYVRDEIRAVHYLPRVTQPVLQFNGRYDSDFRYEIHAKPYFDLIGTDPANKKHVVEDTGHFVSRSAVVGESLDWFDKYLGRPR